MLSITALIIPKMLMMIMAAPMRVAIHANTVFVLLLIVVFFMG